MFRLNGAELEMRNNVISANVYGKACCLQIFTIPAVYYHNQAILQMACARESITSDVFADYYLICLFFLSKHRIKEENILEVNIKQNRTL